MYTFKVLLTALLIGAVCGIIGSVYRNILAYEQPFTKWWAWGQQFEMSKPLLFRVVWVCSKCFAGQLALWFYLLIEILPAICSHYSRFSTNGQNAGESAAAVAVSILGLLCAISAAIITAVFLGKMFERIENS